MAGFASLLPLYDLIPYLGLDTAKAGFQVDTDDFFILDPVYQMAARLTALIVNNKIADADCFSGGRCFPRRGRAEPKLQNRVAIFFRRTGSPARIGNGFGKE